MSSGQNDEMDMLKATKPDKKLDSPPAPPPLRLISSLSITRPFNGGNNALAGGQQQHQQNQNNMVAMAAMLAAFASPLANGMAQVSGGGSAQTGRTVYVGNLPADAAVDELLSQVRFGPIDTVKVLPEKNCAFISFLDPTTAAAFHSDALMRKIHSMDRN
ncbi:hypothetical protein H4Q26_003047 [Puccinia striiformis f. sp. tritici PST-130]|nr:hypothetical protein H4Q26_003047 [Puccinia striiformis f. sp. tritici PST-130]